VEVIGASRVRAGIEPGTGRGESSGRCGAVPRAHPKWCQPERHVNLNGRGGAGAGVRPYVRALASPIK